MMDEQEVEVIPAWVVKKIDDFFFAEKVSWIMWGLFFVFFVSICMIQFCLIPILAYVDTQMFIGGSIIDSQPFGPVIILGLESLASSTRAMGMYLIIAYLCNLLMWYMESHKGKPQ